MICKCGHPKDEHRQVVVGTFWGAFTVWKECQHLVIKIRGLPHCEIFEERKEALR